MDLSTVVTILLGAFLAWRLSKVFLGKVSPEKARAAVASGAQLVDVRTAAEHAAGHLPNAINVPVGELSRRIDELGDKSRPVVVYCASGMRSATAASALRRAGFVEVHDLGGMSRWS